ncbi:hypothetical protein [uncultured Enterococcus sp.]|uniref:hypothetical protein n=1 Tax=uncultured Enterococcus sp. TaxID=167972 RepID=UPI00258F6C5C|nr:hypothetical protein [uncultured Enterococcus sp.]
MLLFFIRLTPYFFGVLLLVYFFKLIILQGKIRSLNSEQELRLREKYPEMTEGDLKARRSEISSYLSHYLMKGFKRYTWLSAAIGAIVFLIAAFVFLFMMEGYIFGVLYAFVFYSAALCYKCYPSYTEQAVFWKDYLEKNPENPLKIDPAPEDPQTIMKSQAKLPKYAFAVANCAIGLTLALKIISDGYIFF